MTTKNIDLIEQQIQKLSVQAQIHLIEKILQNLKRNIEKPKGNKPKTLRDITNFRIKEKEIIPLKRDQCLSVLFRRK